jgi:hypothetical protein
LRLQVFAVEKGRCSCRPQLEPIIEKSATPRRLAETPPIYYQAIGVYNLMTASIVRRPDKTVYGDGQALGSSHSL